MIITIKSHEWNTKLPLVSHARLTCAQANETAQRAGLIERVTEFEVYGLFEAFRWRCWSCGIRHNHEQPLEIDFVFRLKPNGPGGVRISNMRPVCQACNSRERVKRERWEAMKRSAGLAA